MTTVCWRYSLFYFSCNSVQRLTLWTESSVMSIVCILTLQTFHCFYLVTCDFLFASPQSCWKATHSTGGFYTFFLLICFLCLFFNSVTPKENHKEFGPHAVWSRGCDHLLHCSAPQLVITVSQQALLGWKVSKTKIDTVMVLGCVLVASCFSLLVSGLYFIPLSFSHMFFLCCVSAPFFCLSDHCNCTSPGKRMTAGDGCRW